ncbi:succinylglutamate desuccinylase [Colwellia hornerae]|uniref:Succinylglutamate desuccinylase n=1 Tax=Colwellia hornerae TaxID=89402 RepID=A0A5C6QN67_9GAMM|nr:succinylglutamate desuccinylase [Colwellia hornerae]TWX54596.1 succinylglutamate desuccinylase [Colwellia hornerae]TWX61036.1 succinylglutamate desuccinylase [Colwellia hornerae]TWX70289.1 succinylglutamate desuccinylase [Colwellia hornerae]
MNKLQVVVQEQQQALQSTGDFLALTRANEWSLAGRFSFQVQHQASNSQTNVTVLDTGLITFEPVELQTSNKDIVLSSAVHGNETAPIEICAELIKKLILGELACTERVLFIIGNPASINISERFIEENMNRLFSGGHSADQGQGAGLINKERHRALLLENTVRDFFEQGQSLLSGTERERCHYDLHTAIRASKNDKFAVYPFRHGKAWKKSQLQFMYACGVSTILLSHSPTTTFSYFSSNEFNADAFTVELGKVMPFGENDMTKFEQVKETLTRLISGQDLLLKDYDENDFSIYEIYQTINRQGENFALNFSDNVENFTDFPKGTVLAVDDGNEIKTDKDGEAIIFPNANVAIGQRALLTVIPTSIE